MMVNTDADDDNDLPVISLKSRYAEYTAAKTARDNKGVELTTAFQAREMATSAVAAAFTNPQHFYQQLVDRREYKQDREGSGSDPAGGPHGRRRGDRGTDESGSYCGNRRGDGVDGSDGRAGRLPELGG